MSTFDLNIIERFGDVDPVIHGGGIIHEFEGRFNWEFTEGLEKKEEGKCIVYATQIKKEIPYWISNRNSRAAIESYADVKISEMNEETSWLEWADLYRSIGQYFGYHNFDESPWIFDEEELNQRWKLNG